MALTWHTYQRAEMLLEVVCQCLRCIQQIVAQSSQSIGKYAILLFVGFIEGVACRVQFASSCFQHGTNGTAPLPLVSRDDIKCTDSNERDLQGERQRFRRSYGHTQPVERPWSRGNGNNIDSLHGVTTFSHETPNAFQQFYAVVVAHQPGIFAE